MNDDFAIINYLNLNYLKKLRKILIQSFLNNLVSTLIQIIKTE